MSWFFRAIARTNPMPDNRTTCVGKCVDDAQESSW
jgi:hypothetical protein